MADSSMSAQRRSCLHSHGDSAKTTIDILKNLARIYQVLSLSDEAQRAGDPESLLVVKMMDHAVANTRQNLRASVPHSRFAELSRQHPALVVSCVSPDKLAGL